MITLRLYNALRLSSNFNIQRTVQFCGFKSRYNIENLYPNTASDLSPKIPEPSAEGFSGYIPLEDLKITYSKSPHTNRCTVIPKVDTSVEVRFHVPTASWISDAVKEKLLKREADRISKDGYFIIKSDKTRLQLMNQADCLDRIRTTIFDAVDDRPKPELAERQARHEKLKAVVLRQKRSHFEELCKEALS